MNWSDRVVHHALSDVGIKRSHNQDAFGVVLAPSKDVWLKRGHLFLVADGMGAHAVGEMASKLAVDSIGHLYSKMRQSDAAEGLVKAIVEANHTIHEKGRQNREFQGMGTTATSLLLLPTGAYVGHVGDSRCYRIRADRIDQLSYDHSLQWELARRRKVAPEELSSVPSNIIIRSLGPEPEVKVDLNGPYPVRTGDRFVLCSDGLSGLVDDWEIWGAVSYLPGDEACRFLVDLANLRGGIDNITVIIVQVGEPRLNEKTTTTTILPWWSRLPFASQLAEVPLSSWLLVGGFLALLTDMGLHAAGILAERKTLDVLLRLTATILLSASLAALVLRRQRLERRPTISPEEAAPVYRTRFCAVETSTLDDIVGIERRLRELAIEEQWQVDKVKLHNHEAEAERLRIFGDNISAFREYCRTISVLSKGMPERNEKSESFTPNWQATTNS